MKIPHLAERLLDELLITNVYPDNLRLAEAFGVIGNSTVVEPLIAATIGRKHFSDVREGAGAALRHMKNPRAVEPLIGALRKKDEYWNDYTTRRLAAETLGGIGDPRAVGPLIASLDTEPSSIVVNEVIEALAGCGKTLFRTF